jgi:hypothetical protein
MNMSEFSTGFVKADELPIGFRQSAQIMAVTSHDFEEGRKGVVFLDRFHGRGAVLNQTNLRTLISAFGPNSDNWVGKTVIAVRTTADFKGKPMPALRFEIERRAAVGAPAPSANLRVIESGLSPEPLPDDGPLDYPDGWEPADDDI